jgi:hypothetical protein
MKKIKVSFDFDKTLSEKEVQDFAKDLINKGIEVWIVTKRYDCIDKYSEKEIAQWGITDLVKEHQDLFDIAFDLNIPIEHIVFMNNKSKTEFFIENQDFLWHLDDNHSELIEINATTTIIGIHYDNNVYWDIGCLNAIKIKEGN